MADLELALQIALQSHAGQKDKYGAPYIFHPIRVMIGCTTPDARIVALLHDVVEHTSTTFDQLQAAGFSAKVIEALRLVTHQPEEPYDQYIDSLMANGIAREVKIADLEHNSDFRRLQVVDEAFVERLRRNLAAYQRLTAKRDELLGND